MDWKAIIAAYHDGECDAHTRREAEQRLAADPAARAYLAELRALDAALDRVPTATPTADLRDRFWTRFAAETTPTAASAPASTSNGRPALLALPRRATSRPHRQQMEQRRGGGGKAWGVWLSTAAATVVVVGASMAVWWAPSTPDTSGDFGPNVAAVVPTPTRTPTHAPPATPDPAPPSVAEMGMPGDEMLMVLDLLESGLDFQALASLTETDIAILGDESVWNLLENYDNPN